MNLSVFIAFRYLISKKKQNVINIISLISIIGVAVGTAALIIVLSVFNGFEHLIHSLYNSFDPDIEITIAQGKTFHTDSANMNEITNLNGFAGYAEVLEEVVLLKHEDRQYIATMKGVDNGYEEMTGIDSMMIAGTFTLENEMHQFAIIGQGIAYFLSTGPDAVRPLQVYAARRTGRVSLNPERAFNRKLTFPSGVFAIEQEFDSKYFIVPIAFSRSLLEHSKNIVSSIEIDVSPGANLNQVQEKIQEIVGAGFIVKNRYQQNELFYKVMQSEKWAIFLILTFILIIASFNIIGSLTMLIIDKKNDISILRDMGGDRNLISQIFLSEGWLISFVGATIGLFFGVFICWLQKRFELIKLKGSGSFIIDAYPVEIEWLDVTAVFITVLIIGFLAAWYPVKRVAVKFNKSN